MKTIYFVVLLSVTFVMNISAYAAAPQKTQVITQKINLNKADLSALVGSFKGIGKKRAQALIDYRNAHHGFKSIEEIADVKGFSQRFLQANRDKLNEVFVVN